MVDALRRLASRRAEPLAPGVRRALMTASAGAMVALAWWAWQSSKLRLADITWWPLAVSLLVAAPLSLVLKAAEFDVAARVSGLRPSPGRSLRIAVVSSAANLLPLPGSLLVTVRSLASDGTSYSTAVASSAVPGLAWLALTGVGGGIAMVVAGSPWLGLATVAAGAVAGVAAQRILAATAPPAGRASLRTRIIIVELAWLAMSASRLALALVGLGVTPSPAQAVALSVAGAVTVAVGFVPGGLGVREALIAALAPLVGLPFRVGALVGVVDRLVWLAFLAVAVVVSSMRTPEEADR